MDRATSKYRAAIAAELRVQGMGYDEIAESVGYANRSGAWKAVQRALERRTVAAADHLVATSFLDLEILQSAAWPAAMSGDLSAIDVCVRATSDRVRLIERFPSQVGIDELREAADAADSYLLAEGDNGYVSRDPRDVFENSEVRVFVCVSGRVRGRSLVVDKRTNAVRSVGAA